MKPDSSETGRRLLHREITPAMSRIRERRLYGRTAGYMLSVTRIRFNVVQKAHDAYSRSPPKAHTTGARPDGLEGAPWAKKGED